MICRAASAYVFLEDHPHSDQVVAADVENDTLTYSVHSHGTKGNVTWFTYTPLIHRNAISFWPLMTGCL